MAMKNSQEKYLRELAKDYPTRNAVISEIINLNAILNLPKGTEHFLSDIHGEADAFLHICRNASGVIRRKIDMLFSEEMNDQERAELAALCYYPEEKMDALRDTIEDRAAWYKQTLVRLLEVCRVISSKYTRSKVRKFLARSTPAFDYIIDELLNNDYDVMNKDRYYDSILHTIITAGSAEAFIGALCTAIKGLVVDHLHIVGDIFDRGPRPDIVLDELMKRNSLDIQWGNHDILWMGAAAGSPVCVATALNNSLAYKNIDLLEIGYGISLRPLMQFAEEVYAKTDTSAFLPHGGFDGDSLTRDSDETVARMQKAMAVIHFKLEGQTILRNPSFGMEDRLLLDKMDLQNRTVNIRGKVVPLRDAEFPTIDPAAPYRLTSYERELIRYFVNAFARSEKLQRHVRFLFQKGGIYTIYNGNLLFHGCIPLDSDGEFLALPAAKGKRGKDLLDVCDQIARQGYFSAEGSRERERGRDFFWFLWCGCDSPLCGRKRITTFERMLTDLPELWEEPRNDYYRFRNDEETVKRLLTAFSLSEEAHIINGHMPVHANQGEAPVKAGGRLIVIDGGFCRAYQSATGIAGYTLIYNATGMRISAHEPFRGKEEAVRHNLDILSDTVIFETAKEEIFVKDTDIGRRLSENIGDLRLLIAAYESGEIKPAVQE